MRGVGLDEPFFVAPRRRRVSRDGRRPAAARLGAVLGAADLRARRRGDRRGGARGGARRHDASALRPSARSSSRRRSSTPFRRSSACGSSRRAPRRRCRAVRLARGVHAARPGDQVRRLLPRPRRPVPRECRLGARDARHPRVARRSRAASPPTRSSASTTTSTASRAAVERYGEGLAAILVEPVAGNMGCVPPAPGFLEALRLLCDAAGALLVFDEVITGFRVGARRRAGAVRRRRPT